MTDTPLDVDRRVTDFPDKPGAVAWPLPVDVKLEQLLVQARDTGERTSRKEIVAALLATAELTAPELSAMLRRYRTARVRDILPVPEGENVVPFRKQRPGPRRAQS